MEISNIHIVASLGFVIALVVGAVANKTNFCTMGAVSDLINMGHKGRLGAWVLAMGVAVAGVQLLELTGLVDVGSSIYRSPNFGWLGYIIGGLLFGIGMTLGGGCGQRTLVRVGSGNLKALVVFLVLGITAYMTLRGILGVVRLDVFEAVSFDLAKHNLEDQGIASVVASRFAMEAGGVLSWLVAGLISGACILWAFLVAKVRSDMNNLIAGLVIGGAVIAAWIATGLIGLDDFDPVPVEGLSFIAPAGNSISYLMTYTGATISFGIATVFGMITGSFLYAIATRSFKIETFTQREDMINHLLGGCMMGFGGVLALGCTVGQGVSGVSTLATGSFVALLSIILGSAITMRVQYHRMDDLGWFRSWANGVADIVFPWRKTAD